MFEPAHANKANSKRHKFSLAVLFSGLLLIAPAFQLGQGLSSSTMRSPVAAQAAIMTGSLPVTRIPAPVPVPALRVPGPVPARPRQLAGDWIPVPNWMTGTWQASSEVVLYSFDYRQQVNVVDEPMAIKISRANVIGTQRDESGQIWHYTGAPYKQSTETASYIETQSMKKIELLSSSEDEVKIRCFALVTRQSKENGILIDMFKESTVTTYSPVQEGLMEVSFAICDYDMNNQPIHVSRTVCTVSRVKNFAPVNYDQRGDLQQKFIMFMNSRNMNRPDDSK